MLNKFFLLLLILIFQACYSLNGISIPDNVNTYYIETFKLKAQNAPPLINQIFTEKLKNKINTQTKLVANDNSPDIEFRGEISTYAIEALAPTRDQESTLNRLRVSINVEYINSKDEKGSWKQTFSQNFDFSADQDLLSIQDQAIAEIYDQIIEQIFNKSFANW